MERNGFNPSSFETSGDKSDDSKEKTKTKKKRSAEAVAETPTDTKKEAVADRTKALLDKFLGEQKNDNSEKKAEVGKQGEVDAKPESDADMADESREQETGAEHSDENDPHLEQLTPEEDAEILRNLVEDKLVELEAGRDEKEAPEEAAGREAAITMLEQMRDEATDIGPEEAELTEEPEEDFVLSGTAELSDVPEELDNEQTVPLNKPAPKPSLAGGNSGGTAPPTIPSRPSAAGAPLPPFGTGNSSRVTVERLVMPGTEKDGYQPDYHENPNRTYLLVGGIVGYLIGRRRGRIKTEKRLAVVQRKLEKQVEAKQQEINEKTEAVRRLARQNYEQARQFSATAERASVDQTSERILTRPEQVRPRLEQIQGELRPKSAVNEKARPGVERQEIRTEKTSELTDSDISRLSETITIGATNLRKIYEAKLITDGGLRRLVNEHLQGKDIRRGLAREFLTKELSYERDPRFRDIVPLEAKGQRSQGGSVVDQVTTDPVALEEQAIAADQSLHPRGIRKPIPVKQKRAAMPSGLLTVLSFVALLLAAYAVWLGLMR